MLTRVDTLAPLGLQFTGQWLSPGALFDPGDLPRPAVVLECAGSHRVKPGRNRDAFDCLWLLWQYDFKSGCWVEVVRSFSEGDTSWTYDFARIAHRRLFPEGERPADERARPLAEELSNSIRAALESVNRDARCYVVALLDQFIGREIVRVSAEFGVHKVGFGKKAQYPRLGAHPGCDPGERRAR